jgi:hypothetical protein
MAGRAAKRDALSNRYFGNVSNVVPAANAVAAIAKLLPTLLWRQVKAAIMATGPRLASAQLG